MADYIKVKEMYTPQAHYVCDRDKNYACPRVKNGLPCGDCKGTKYREFAKVFNEEEEMKDYKSFRRKQKIIYAFVIIMFIVMLIANIYLFIRIMESDLPAWYKWLLLK